MSSAPKTPAEPALFDSKTALDVSPGVRGGLPAPVAAGEVAMRQALKPPPEPTEELDLHPELGPVSANARPSSALLLPDTKEVGSVLGNYRILSLLGVGGMSRVFLAEHIHIGRRVALKMLNAELARSSVAVQRFFQEARSVSLIKHSHLIQVTDFIQTNDGVVAFVMELLEGQSLSTVIALQAPLGVERVLWIAIQTADALAAVHATGLVHRDLKPSNIFLLSDQGEPDFVKVLDFGIAKIIDTEANGPDDAAKTHTGVVLGTPRYMAPEHAQGQEADTRSDIYMLGVVMYEMLTGANPFVGKTPIETMMNQVAITPVAPSVYAETREPIPRDLDTVVLACLRKDPSRRWPSMRALHTALLEIQAHHCLSSTSKLAAVRAPYQLWTDANYTLRRWYARNRRRAVLVSAAAALFLTVGLVAAVGAGRQFGAAREATTATPQAYGQALGIPAPAPVSPELTAPSTVLLTFESTPPGATVSDVLTGEILGTTPFARSFPLTGERFAVQFKKSGYLPVVKQLGRQANAMVSVALAKAAEARPPKRPVKPRSGKKSADPDATLNPF